MNCDSECECHMNIRRMCDNVRLFFIACLDHLRELKEFILPCI